MTETDKRLFNKEPQIIFAIDLLLSVAASVIAILLIRWVSTSMPGFVGVVIKWGVSSIIATMAALGCLRINKISLEFITISAASKIAFSVLLKEIALICALLLGILPEHSIKLSVYLLLIDGLFTFTGLILTRSLLVYFLQNRKRSLEREALRRRVLVYGISQKSVAQITRLKYSSAYDIVGIIVTDKSMDGRVVSEHKVFSVTSQEEFDILCAKFGGIESVLFSRDGDALEQKDTIINWCITAGVNVLVSPRIENLLDDDEVEKQKKENAETESSESRKFLLSNNNFDAYKQSLGQTYVVDGMSSFGRTVKRMTDFFCSAILLIVFSPLFIICFILIKKDDGGPAIYKQERIGRFGRPFYIYKFRSMRLDAEKMGPALYAGDDDPRLTKIGKFLRQHHLDELPQLFNVFRGDMAFVGYRPERKFYIDQILEKDPRYIYLFQIRPGVTSYATLRNGYTDTIEKMLRRLEFDLFYLSHRSWFFDIKVLWLTFANIAFGKKF